LKREKSRIASSRKVANLTKKVSQWVLIPKKKIKTKTQTTATLKKKKRKELLLRAKKIVYARDKDICQRCDKKCIWSDRHASHVIPVSATGRLALYPLNMKVMCYHCHLNRRHKNPIEAGRWFASKFPERLQELERIASEIWMWSITMTELEEIERIIEKDEKSLAIR
jgi:5-methylcytosine-specific restriction endonuclease McrA